MVKMNRTKTQSCSIKTFFRLVKCSVVLLLMLGVWQVTTLVPVEAQRWRIFKPVPPALGRVARVAESGAIAEVKLARLPRQSITPAFGMAARSALTRESVTTALRSAGIRRRAINVATGSLTKTPRVLPTIPKLTAISSGTFAVGKTAAELNSGQALRHAFDVRKLISPSLSPKAKLTLGKAFNEATGRAAAARALETQAAAVEKIFNEQARLHKNSRFFRAPSHAYVIVAPDGRLFKVGESSAGLLKNGLSKRAQTQVNQLNRRLPTAVTGKYRSRIISTFDSKQEARDYERELILRYRQKYKDRRFVLPGNRERFASLDNKQTP
jgi:URI fold toxin 2